MFQAGSELPKSRRALSGLAMDGDGWQWVGWHPVGHTAVRFRPSPGRPRLTTYLTLGRYLVLLASTSHSACQGNLRPA